MVLWNLLDGAPSHSRPLIEHSESMWAGTLGTIPYQEAQQQTQQSQTQPQQTQQ
jgi:hypothetical protein